jgi:hypothetical protein
MDASARRLTLSSLSDMPMRAQPGNLDGRWLGMAIYGMRVVGDGLKLDIGSGWSGFGAGFHRDEGKHRWTDGNGTMSPAMLASFSGEVTVEIDGHGLERYRTGAALHSRQSGG